MRPNTFDNIDPRALEVNRYTIETLKELPDRAPIEEEIFDIFNKTVGEFGRFTIVEYGSGFDSRFFLKFMKSISCNFEDYFESKTINACAFVKLAYKLDSYELGNVARNLVQYPAIDFQFSKPVDQDKLHSAAYDLELLMKVCDSLCI
jgi:hypothetical protein